MKAIFGERLHFDWKVAAITVISTLLLMADHYFELTSTFLPSPWWKVADRTILYLVIPLLIIRLVFRERAAEFGFTVGDWRTGLLLTLGGIVLMAPILWLLNRGDASMQAYYRPYLTGLPWNTFLDLFGWEFLFRGWLLFGYTHRYGPDGIWLQAVPFALAHVGKPAVETFSTIFGGFLFGWVAYRTRSFLYPFLIHWFVATFTVLVAAGAFGN